MQRIRIGELTSGVASLIEIPFTSVLASNLQTRISGATLANASIVVKIKQGGVATAVTGTGTFTATDDTNANGVRGYRPVAADVIVGINTFVFTGTNMEPREVVVMVQNEDAYAPAFYGAVIAGTLTTTSFTTNLPSPPNQGDALVEFLTGANAGCVKPIGTATFAAGPITTITLKTGYTLPNVPSAADKFRIITH